VLGQSALIDDLIRKTKSRVAGELRFQQELLALNGALDMVLAQAALG
jgi:U3 small nucleolar RNA-associated protein 15